MGKRPRRKRRMWRPARLLAEMEYDLQATREDLQGTIEELEASNEELKASNEEVLSMK